MIKLPKELTTITPLSKFLAMGLFILLPFVGFYLGTQYQEMMDIANKDGNSSIKACTEEAKICPDGSAVGRTGPNCEFAACPSEDSQTVNWKMYKNTKYGFTIQYPASWNVKDGNSRLDIHKGYTELTFYFYSDPDAGVSDYPKAINQETINIGDESIILNHYTSTVTKQHSAFSDLRSLTTIGKYISNVNFYLDDENREIDLLTIKQILSTFKFTNQEQVACTQDAKLCPDGKTYVSRQEPNCEFSACP